VLAGMVALLDYIGIVAFPVGFFSVSAFYVGAAFFTAFAVWFKWKGLLAIYFGLLIGALLAGTFTVFAFVLAMGNVLGAAVPMLFFRYGNFDFGIKNWKAVVIFIISATILQNVISAAWTLYGFSLFGLMPVTAVIPAAIGWILGGVVVSIILGIPLLRFVSPLVKRMSIFEK
jgi:hypothetical protein